MALPILLQAERFTPQWFIEDPTGRMIAGAVVVVIAMIVLVIVVRSLKWAAARKGQIIWGAVIVAGLYWGAVTIIGGGLMVWIIAGLLAFALLLFFALFLTHAN